MSEHDALHAELDSATREDRFSGTVLVAKNGTTIFSAARGWADREHRIANTLDTRFRIGSMTKMFTAVAVMQLVQTGKLALDEKLGAVLRDYPNRRIAETVSIHQLLTHTGGTGSIFGPQYDRHRLELREVED